MNKLFAYLIIGMFFISLASAVSIGTFKQKENVKLYQTCNNCTYCNLTSINYPNSSAILSNVAMIQQGTYYYYNLNGGNTTLIGDYNYCYDCGNAVEKETGCLDFSITSTGTELSNGESILYAIFIIIIFGGLLLLFYFIIVLPSENEENDRGTIIGIVKLKYLRIFLIAMMYPLIIILLNLLNGLAVNYTTLTMFSGTLGFLFEVMLRGAWVFTIVIIIWIVYLLVQDSNVKKQLSKLGRFRING